jgi:DNA-binding HxlR family transcriptional regulator
LSSSHADVTVLAERAAPVAEAIDCVSGRWTVGILTVAAQGPVRFTDLQRALGGISRRMLALKLRQLERDGLVARTAYPAGPSRVEYALTAIAAELLETLRGLTDWAARHQGTVAASRAAFDLERRDFSDAP